MELFESLWGILHLLNEPNLSEPLLIQHYWNAKLLNFGTFAPHFWPTGNEIEEYPRNNFKD